jgi:serine/threonine-protein kinase RsbW
MLFATAVAEVATNIIRHREPGAETTMVLTLRVEPDRIEALFSDDGSVVVTLVPDASSSDELAESGRGLDIARATLDEISYTRADGLNQWHLLRRRAAPSTGQG